MEGLRSLLTKIAIVCKAYQLFKLIDLGDKRLEKELPDMHQRVADNLDSISALMENFAEQTTTFSDKNNITALKEQEALKI